MKKIIRIIAVVLTVATVVSCFAGCNGSSGDSKGKKTGSKNIEISFLNQGYGREWIDKLVENFNKANPEYNVFIRSTADDTTATASFGMPKIDTTDLYITSNPNRNTYVEPLDDFLKTTADGDSKTIGEKYKTGYLEALRWKDGHIYSLGLNGSVLSVVYNKELFKKAGIETIPRTSDELATVCTMLSDEGITPMCHFMNGGYWWKMVHFWWGQYEGVEKFQDFYANPTKEKFLRKDGRYKALKACEKITTPEFTMVGSNTENHVSVQTKFLTGKAAMMVNASWLSTEMSDVKDLKKFDVMRPPMISTIVEKCTTVKNDQQLRKVISAIDSILDGKKKGTDYKNGDSYSIDGLTVSKEDWDLLYAARTSIYSDAIDGGAFIPTYSDAKKGAKKFLAYCLSDEGQSIIASIIHTPMVLDLSKGEVDISGYSDLQKGFTKLAQQSENFIFSGYRAKDRIFTDGGAWAFGLASYFYVPMMSNKNENDRITADDAWKYITDVISDNYEGWQSNVKK